MVGSTKYFNGGTPTWRRVQLSGLTQARAMAS